MERIKAMQRILKHVEELAELMDQKGYDGMFLSSYGFTGKLNENLKKHVLHCIEEKKEIGPVNLSIYSKWIDDKSPYVRSDFKVNYSNEKGFEVAKMDIHYANPYGTIRDKELLFRSNREIPDRIKANRMIVGRKRGMKL